MPDSKITALTSISTSTDPANDPLVIVDLSDTSMAATGTTKKVTLNQLLATSPTATLASATITGALTGQSSASFYTGTALPLHIRNSGTSFTQIGDNGTIGAGTAFIVGSSDASLRFQCGGAEQMRLNSTGLGVGVASPATKLDINGGVGGIGGQNHATFSGNAGRGLVIGTRSDNVSADRTATLNAPFTGGGIVLQTQGTDRLTLDSSGNVGIGVVPTVISGASGNGKGLQGDSWTISSFLGTDQAYFASNLYTSAYGVWSNRINAASGAYLIAGAEHRWLSGSAQAPGTITPTQAMTLDASGNLLVGTTSATAGAVFKVTGTVSNGKSFEVFNTASSTNSAFYCSGSGVVNGVATGAGAGGLITVNKDSGNSRSISAAGTINASGADYAEYMTKAGGFVLSKGDVAGIDANGKLTNVFADAVSFVVKSTDPSYVGNDKWSVDLEGDVLEAARQLVDRIAFAGQVPVNVTGAKAGDYIVPVVDGTGIKGISVSNPTFEQYQIAVGKVIAIDADGRARIIVKVA